MPSTMASTMSLTTGRRATLISAGRYNHGGSDVVWATAASGLLSRHDSLWHQRVRAHPRPVRLRRGSWWYGPDQSAPACGVDPDDPAGARGLPRTGQPAGVGAAAARRRDEGRARDE